MKSRKTSLLKRLSFLTPILFLALIFTWQGNADALTTVTFGDNTGDDFPGTVEDALIPEPIGYRDFNYGGRGDLHVGDPADIASTRRSFIRFKDIALSIGPGKVITSATMYLYCNNESSTTDYSISTYRVLLNWGEGNSNGTTEVGAVCCNDAQYDGDVDGIPWNAVGCNAASNVTGEDSTADRRASAEYSTIITGTGWFSWDLTTAVQNWYGGDWKEYGVILINDSENIANSLKTFLSSENINDGYRPYFSVTYYTEGAGLTLTVCQSGSCDYTTIQPALAAANPGDTVKVMDSATYTSLGGNPIKMKSYVDLVSDTGVTPTIYGQSYPAVTFEGPLRNCTLDGFTITGGMLGLGGQVYMLGSGGAVTNVTVQNCVLDGSVGIAPPGPGIKLEGPVAPTIKDTEIKQSYSSCITTGHNQVAYTGFPIVIEGCNIHDARGEGGLGGAGIRIVGNGSDSIQVTIRSGATSTSQIYNNPRAGISLANLGPGVVTIDNNTIDNNGTTGTAGTDGLTYAGVYINNVGTATITNNEIKNHINAAGICIEGNSDVTIGADLLASDPFPYGNDIYGNYAGIYFRSANSEPVIIRGNNIYSNNGRGGIRIKAALTGNVTITQNSIHDNNRGGISIQNDCTATITKNNVYSSSLGGGIHTGEVNTFYGTVGGANLTIRQNKVHNNNGANYGGGIDVRHASGIIENNLVYKNGRGGIRIGNDISDVINNTVVWNGFNNTLGGGIIYDDPATGLINDPPDKTYTDPTLPFIRNNICAYNRKAGIGVVFDNTGYERDYNLLYDNWYGETVLGYNYGDCSWTGWPGCKKRQLGGAWPVAPNEIFGDPLFETGTDNYHLQSGSPAEGAGDDLTDMGCYGGDFPIDDAEIP